MWLLVFGKNMSLYLSVIINTPELVNLLNSLYFCTNDTKVCYDKGKFHQVIRN